MEWLKRIWKWFKLSWTWFLSNKAAKRLTVELLQKFAKQTDNTVDDEAVKMIADMLKVELKS